MGINPPRPTTARPGGRAAQVVARVRQATLELLSEGGYDALQLPDVATRAQVNKTTVYRRWPTKAELVSDVLLAATDHRLPELDRGSLLEDLTALLHDITDLLDKPLIRAMLRSALDNTLDHEARRAFWNERNQRSAVIIDRAIHRGELPPGTNPRSVLEHASSTIYFRRLVTGDPVTEHDIHLVAARAILAAQAQS
jgi:AcrR family transcriptional regulator